MLASQTALPPLQKYIQEKKTGSVSQKINVKMTAAGRRFEDLDWTRSESGGPSLPGVLMRIHCELEQVHVAGDHDVVIARVLDLEDGESGRPMLFYRGRLSVSERRTSSARDDAPESIDDYWG